MQQMVSVDRLPEADRLYVGEGVMIHGDVVTDGTVIVQGVLQGDLSVGNLVVGKLGTITGRTNVAESAEIFGKVIERLTVRGLLILRSTCRVSGNVNCGVLQIEPGAIVTGGINSIDGQAGQHGPKGPRKAVAQPAPADLLPELPAATVLTVQESDAARNSRGL